MFNEHKNAFEVALRHCKKQVQLYFDGEGKLLACALTVVVVARV